MTTYTITDLIQILRMKPRAIRRLINTGRLQGRMVGRQFLVSQWMLQEFLNGDGKDNQPSRKMQSRCLHVGLSIQCAASSVLIPFSSAFSA